MELNRNRPLGLILDEEEEEVTLFTKYIGDSTVFFISLFFKKHCAL
jgi:hypothetical protein